MKDLERRSILRNDKGTVDVTGSFRRHDNFVVAAPYCIGAARERCSLGGAVAHW
jgi:hypothetical protein